MNKQILNIVNFQILYEILDEIKENLFFEIVNYKDKNEFLKNSKTTLQQELVITKDKTFSEGNVLFIDNGTEHDLEFDIETPRYQLGIIDFGIPIINFFNKVS